MAIPVTTITAAGTGSAPIRGVGWLTVGVHGLGDGSAVLQRSVDGNEPWYWLETITDDREFSYYIPSESEQDYYRLFVLSKPGNGDVTLRLGNRDGADATRGQLVHVSNASIPVTVSGSITPVSPSGIVAGAKTVATAGTRETLVASSTPCRSVTMTAEDSNTGKIYYGGSTVSSSLGDYIFPAQKITIEIDDVQKIYIDADVSTDGVKFSYLT